MATIQVVVEGVDKASGVLGEIATGALRRIGEVAVNVAGSGISALFDAFRDGLGDARETQKLMAQTGAVIKSTGGAAGVTAQQVADYATALSDASGKSLFGDDQIQQSENLLLTFTNIKDKTLEAATAISVDMAQALGGAPKDSAIQLGKALNDPISGITALTRVGVTFTDEQKAQIKAMQDAGNMAGAQGVILAELNKEFGGSAEAAAKAAGGWNQFQARLGEVKESLGAAVLPLLDQLGSFLNTTVAPAIEGAVNVIIPFVQGILSANDPIQALIASTDQVIPGFASFVAVATAVASFVADNLGPILAGLATALLIVVVPAFITWAAAASAAAIATITALAPVVIPIAAIGAAVGLLVAAWQNDWGGIRTTLEGFWTGTGKPIFDTLQTWLEKTLTDAIATLSGFWTDTLQPAMKAVWSFLTTYIFPALQLLWSLYIATLKVELAALALVWNTVLKPALSAVWSFITTYVSPVLSTLANTYIADVETKAEALATFWTNTLKPALEAVANAISTVLKPAFEGAKDIFTSASGWFDAISTAVKGVVGWLGDLADKWNAMKPPDWLKGSSPPPMADWFTDIGNAAAFASSGISLTGQSLVAASPAGQSVTTTHLNLGGITVNGARGQNVDQLVDVLLRRIDQRVKMRRS